MTENEESFFMAKEFQFVIIKILEMESGDGCATVWIYLMSLNLNHLKMVKMANFTLWLKMNYFHVFYNLKNN